MWKTDDDDDDDDGWRDKVECDDIKMDVEMDVEINK